MRAQMRAKVSIYDGMSPRSVSYFTHSNRPQWGLHERSIFFQQQLIEGRMMNMNQIGHRCIQIGRQALQTCRHRPMEIGAILADDQKSYFIFGRQEKCLF